MGSLKVYVDGGCPENPGRWMGIGVWCNRFTISEGWFLKQGSLNDSLLTAKQDLPLVINGYAFHFFTNNIAEFLALHRAVDRLEVEGIRNARIYSDSQFTVKIIKGEHHTGKKHLRIFVETLQRGIKKGSHTLLWCPRSENLLADSLATEAVEKKGYSYVQKK